MTNPTIPQDVAAEEAVLGSVLINPDTYYELSDLLHADDFYIVRNRWLWDAFKRIVDAGQVIDIMTAANALGSKLAEFGGNAHLADLVLSPPTSYHAINYAKIVKSFSERRKAIQFAQAMVQDAYNLDKTFDMTDHTIKIAMSQNGDGRKSSKEAAGDAVDIVLNPRSLTTGAKTVDKFIGGYFPAELAILAGYQGAGKSAIMKQSARINAEAGAKILLMSFEESAAQVYLKMACGDMEINPSILRSDAVSDEAKANVTNYASKLGEKYEGKIIIYEKRRTPSGIMLACLREHPDIVFIDTLKNVAGQTGESLQAWYDYVVEFLRSNIAKRLDIPVVLLHHLNRSSATQGREPILQDLKYAGESDADSVHILHSPEERMAGQKIAPVKWKCVKARFGAVGAVEMAFNLPQQRFYPTDKEHK